MLEMRYIENTVADNIQKVKGEKREKKSDYTNNTYRRIFRQAFVCEKHEKRQQNKT